jgi:hypothetical protein
MEDENGENYVMRCIVACILHPVLFRLLNQGGCFSKQVETKAIQYFCCKTT